MSREQSNMIKGIAILMMVWIHLFVNGTENCHYSLFLSSVPIEVYIRDAMNPVPFFMIVSGYGVTYSFYNKRIDIKRQLRKVCLLYVYYWLIMALFSVIRYFYTNDFNFTALDLLGNITGYNTSFNKEMWFLFPYCVIYLSSSYIISFLDLVFDSKKRVIMISALYIIVFGLSKYLYSYMFAGSYVQALYFPIHHTIYLLLSFSLGFVLYNLLNEYKTPHFSSSINFLLLILLFVLKCCVPTSVFDCFYAFVFVWLFAGIKINNFVKNILTVFGTYSMLMWMTHTYYSKYVFPDFIYGFKYPLLIYIVLVLISLVTAVILKRVLEPLTKHII